MRLILAAIAVAVLCGLVFAPAASAAAGDFTINGRGNGHAEGMSQWGAWQGARLGKTYQDILAFYYPGTALSDLATVAPTRSTITVRLTTNVDTFTQVQLTAAATSATLVDSTGATISSVAIGGTVTLVYNGGKVQVSGNPATYSYVDLRPDSDAGRVTVNPTPITGWSSARSYWGTIRILPDTTAGQLYIYNILPMEKYVSGVAEIASDWAQSSSTAYYALEAVKAQAVAARTYIAAHSSAVPYDDWRDVNYVGYNYEASYPGVVQAQQATAGKVLTYGGKVFAAHFSSSSGGYTTNSAWSDSGAPVYEPAQADPWSATSPPTNAGYAWSVTMSPATVTADLNLGIGTVTQITVTQRDTSDPTSHARYLMVTGTSGSATIAARTFQSRLGLKSTLILSITTAGASLPRYDHTASQIQYYSASNQYTQTRPGATGSSWATFTTASAYGGSYARANTSTASIVIPFNGTQLNVIAMKGTTVGTETFSVDGGTPTSVNLNLPAGSTAQYQQQVFTTGTLPAGLHFVTIKNATAGKYITLDAVEVAGSLVAVTPNQQTAGNFVYVPNPWLTFSSTSASGGSYARSSTAGASVTVKFNGLRFDYIAMKGTTLGITDIYLDGTLKATLNLYSATATYQQVIWSTGWLPSGTHTIVIKRNSGSAAGRYVTLDRGDVWGALQ